MDTTNHFLVELFGDKPGAAAVQIWIKTKKPITWFLSDLDTAASIAQQHAKQYDVYVGCGIAAREHDKPQRQRLKADEVAGIPGVWADLDINGGPDAKEGAAPDWDAAMQLAHSVLAPSVIVSSGYGLQAWWLFETPWIFESVAERVKAERMVRGYQATLLSRARESGFRIDPTHDLARILRVPGTLNHKGDEPADVGIAENEGNRYSLDEVSQHCAVVDRVKASENGHGVSINTKAALDGRVMHLVMEEPEFEALWRMNTKAVVVKKLRDSTPSGVEFEIARWLARGGLTAQAVCDALVAWRNTLEPGDPRGKLRADRLGQTISRAMSSVSHEVEERVIEQEQEDALQHMAEVKVGIKEPNRPKLVAMFNRVIRGPALASLKQYSRDPASARFVIELEDGREVHLGPFSNIASQAAFRQAYGIATGHYPPAVKKGWDDAVAALLKAAEVIDEEEDSSTGQIAMWIREYIDAAGSTDRAGACESNLPFTEGAGIYVTLRGMFRFMRRMGERIELSDLSTRLRMLGYERRTIYFEDRDGHRSSRSYFTNTQPKPPGRPTGAALES